MRGNRPDTDLSFLICNHFSSDLLEIQVELFRRLNPERNYRLVVSDDSDDADERRKLEEFRDRGEIDVLVFVKSDSTDGSERHALSLARGFQQIKTRFVCFMDADFFWLKNNFASFLSTKLSEGNCRVFGAQRAFGPTSVYSRIRTWIRSWVRNWALRVLKIDMTVDTQLSPAMFCLCMDTEIITRNNLSFSYPGMLLFIATLRDTGYQIRQFLERTLRHDQMICLEPVDYEPSRRGSRVGHLYVMGNELIGFHLNHATVPKGPDTSLTEEEIQVTRAMRHQLRGTISELLEVNAREFC
jgi:hypothetical protein